MTKLEAVERLSTIVKVWELQISNYPAEVQAAQTTLVVLRGPDIEAMKAACEALTRDVSGGG